MKIIIGVGSRSRQTSPCLQLMFADPPNEGLVLQVVHRPPAQHLLRQAGGRHHGPSLLIQAGRSAHLASLKRTKWWLLVEGLSPRTVGHHF